MLVEENILDTKKYTKVTGIRKHDAWKPLSESNVV